MSFYTLQTPLSSIKPKVWIKGDRLYARTSYPFQVLTLGTYCRSLDVDRAERMIHLETILFWFKTIRREIPFKRVAYIDTKYSDLGTSFGWTGSGFGRHDKVERYSVSLFLKDPEEQVKLFTFCGAGAVKTGTSGVLWGGDSLIDTCGDQADHFQFFLRALTEFLDVPIGGADYIPVKDETTGLQYRCSICKRPSLPGRRQCWMCGSPVEPVVPTGGPAMPSADGKSNTSDDSCRLRSGAPIDDDDETTGELVDETEATIGTSETKPTAASNIDDVRGVSFREAEAEPDFNTDSPRSGW